MMGYQESKLIYRPNLGLLPMVISTFGVSTFLIANRHLHHNRQKEIDEGISLIQATYPTKGIRGKRRMFDKDEKK